MDSRRLRHVAFLAMCVAFVSLTVQVARASSDLARTCMFWNFESDVACTFDSSSGTWSASGSYDFSEMDENDALARAGDLCDAFYWAADYDCYPSQDFLTYLYNYHGQQYPEECFITWTSGFSCDIGTTGSFSAGCGVMNWCAS